MRQKAFPRNFREVASREGLAAAYEIIPWPRFPEITLKSLHDHHTVQLAW
jgi:hypothetical protein